MTAAPTLSHADTVPLVDLRSQHAEIAAAVAEGLEQLFRSQAFILGPEVTAFEQAFAAFTGVRHCVGVANGTEAIELSLRALGIGAGDDVLVPANTFIATALAVSRAGATPVFVDIDPVTHLIDVSSIESHVTPRCKAVVAVHLYGQMAPLRAVRAVAQRHGLAVLEDAAQAHGALQHGQPPGRGGVAATSFYPGKNLGCYGDGGAVLTDSDETAERVRRLRDYGSTQKYRHVELGMNSRLDSVQAVVLHAKLAHLAEWNAARGVAARRYDELLADLWPLTRPATLTGNSHVWHLYTVRVPDRDDVLRELRAAGIDAGIHYPVPIHLQPVYRHLGYRRGDLPTAELAADQILSLPLFPHITVDQQARVADVLMRTLP